MKPLFYRPLIPPLPAYLRDTLACSTPFPLLHKIPPSFMPPFLPANDIPDEDNDESIEGDEPWDGDEEENEDGDQEGENYAH